MYIKFDISFFIHYVGSIHVSKKFSSANCYVFLPDAKGDNKQPSTSDNNEENATGEDTTHSKLAHNRASTETLILDNCYETAQDIQADLERSTDEEENEKKNDRKSKPQSKSSVKSIRDFIEYTEPLTPMLQEVLHDFATDDESDRMLIDEDFAASETKSNSPDPAVLSQSILKPKVVPNNPKTSNEGNEEKTNHDSNKEVAESNEQPEKIVENQHTEVNEESAKNIDASLSQFEDVMKLVDKALAKHLGNELDTQKDKSQDKVRNSNENSSAITDTLLPNNQEAINSGTFPKPSSLPSPQVNDDQNGDESSKKRKRSSSADIIEINKTKKQKTGNHSNTNKKHSDALEIIVSNETSKNTDVEQSLELSKKTNENDAKAHSGTEKNNAETIKKKHNLKLNNGKGSNIESKGQKKYVQKETVTHDITSDGSETAVNNPAQVENPCLKSVSLFAEQFSLNKYSDSDLEIVEDDDKKKTTEKNPERIHQDTVAVEKANDVILLKSRSNSESKTESPVRLTMKQRRDKIAKVFGLTNGKFSGLSYQ